MYNTNNISGSELFSFLKIVSLKQPYVVNSGFPFLFNKKQILKTIILLLQ